MAKAKKAEPRERLF